MSPTDRSSDGDELRTDGSGEPRADGGTSSRTDGGTPEEAPDRAAAFRSETDYSMSRADELRELYDRKFYAPLRILMNDYRGVAGLTIMLFYLLMGTVGVMIVPEPFQRGPSLLPPLYDPTFPLGTDPAGNGLVRNVVHATPDMLQLMAGGVIFATLMSIGIGTVSGYKMGMTDRVLMTITDTAMNLPGFPMLLVIVAVLQPTNPFLIGVVLSINSWPGGARGLRSQVLQIRGEDHVEAAKTMGLPLGHIVQKHVLPELLPIIVIGALGGMTGVIYAAVGLYFLGILPVGVDAANWGIMLNDAYQQVNYRTFENFHYMLVPLVTISMLGLGNTLLAQAFDRVFNPRLRAKHAKTVDADEDEDGGEGGAVAMGALTR